MTLNMIAVKLPAEMMPSEVKKAMEEQGFAVSALTKELTKYMVVITLTAHNELRNVPKFLEELYDFDTGLGKEWMEEILTPLVERTPDTPDDYFRDLILRTRDFVEKQLADGWS